MKRICHFLLLMLPGLNLSAQLPAFQRLDYIQVSETGRELRFPWTGGLNSVLFGQADMNQDGNNDLVVYDKTNTRMLVFRSKGLENSTDYLPDTAAYDFPVVEGWFVLKDYNCDGIEDFFTYSGDGSLAVYTGQYSNGKLGFRLQQKGFYFQGFSGDVNVYNVTVDKPALTDMNNDGDLDIVTFGVSGTRIVYYENQQRELSLPCDSLYFRIGDNCWGNIYEDGLSPTLTLQDTCTQKFPRIGSPERILHVGSTLEVADINGDGLKDALLGDVSLNNLNYLRNEGSAGYASFLQQDTSFPSYNVPLRINYFPVPAFLDADNDGKTDLLAASFDAVSGANVNSIWFYKNLSSDSFRLQLVYKDFLVRDMIDAGEGSHPCFVDADNDGLQDILLGSNGYKDLVSEPSYRWRLYRNSGTAAYPYFTLVQDNFLNLDSLLLKEGAPAAGDLDNDGDIDLIAGLNDGKLAWWENTAGVGNVPAWAYRGSVKDNASQPVSVGANAMPSIVDLDGDNRSDLVIGERNGNLNFYKGTTSSALQFQYVTDSLGKIRIKAPFTTLGYTAPAFADLDSNGKADLVLGNYVFGLLWYKDVADKLAGDFGIPDTLALGATGYRTAPVLADLSGDGRKELLVGNLTGGLQLFSTLPPPFQPVGVRDPLLPALDVRVFPSPADDRLRIWVPGNTKALQVDLYDLLGRLLLSYSGLPGEFTELKVSALPEGLYLLKAGNGEREGMVKVLVRHAK